MHKTYITEGDNILEVSLSINSNLKLREAINTIIYDNSLSSDKLSYYDDEDNYDDLIDILGSNDDLWEKFSIYFLSNVYRKSGEVHLTQHQRRVINHPNFIISHKLNVEILDRLPKELLSNLEGPSEYKKLVDNREKLILYKICDLLSKNFPNRSKEYHRIFNSTGNLKGNFIDISRVYFGNKDSELKIYNTLCNLTQGIVSNTSYKYTRHNMPIYSFDDCYSYSIKDNVINIDDYNSFFFKDAENDVYTIKLYDKVNFTYLSELFYKLKLTFDNCINSILYTKEGAKNILKFLGDDKEKWELMVHFCCKFLSINNSEDIVDIITNKNFLITKNTSYVNINERLIPRVDYDCKHIYFTHPLVNEIISDYNLYSFLNYIFPRNKYYWTKLMASTTVLKEVISDFNPNIINTNETISNFNLKEFSNNLPDNVVVNLLKLLSVDFFVLGTNLSNIDSVEEYYSQVSDIITKDKYRSIIHSGQEIMKDLKKHRSSDRRSIERYSIGEDEYISSIEFSDDDEDY